MKPTVSYRKNESVYEFVSKVKKALRAMGNDTKQVFDIAVHCYKLNDIEQIKKYLRQYVIVVEREE